MFAHPFPSRSRRLARRRTIRPRLERFEDRCVPSLYTVSSLADSGPSSLRDILTAANADPTASTITFDPALNGGTIALSSAALPAITASGLSIEGPGASLLTVSGSDKVGIFSVAAGAAHVSISGLTIAHGRSYEGNPGGPALSNAGEVTLSACTVSDNHAGVGLGIISASGGGILNDGTMTVSACTISSNSATASGLSSHLYGIGGHGEGGGILNRGTMTISACTISSNSTSGWDGVRFSPTSGDVVISPGSADGGGIANSGTLAIRASTIAGNKDPALTGGIIALSSGGGISNSGTLTLSNSLIANNSASSGPDISGTITSQGNNLDPERGNGLPRLVGFC
jgi:hypothetical protein